MILGLDSLLQPIPLQGYALGMHGSPSQSLITLYDLKLVFFERKPEVINLKQSAIVAENNHQLFCL
ncbi:hypothetical protein IC575_003082 [Cucumis melo]